MSKNVSNQFKNIIKNGGPFYAYAVMTLADGTEITLTSENDFTVSGSGYSEESDSGFPFGSALSKIITLNLDNTVTSEPLKDTQSENILDTQNNTIIVSRKSEKYDYYYARIVLYTEADLPDGTTERVQEGIFTVIDSVTPGDVLEITAYDDMYKADVEFSSTLTYPVSAQMLLNEVCSKCDITLGSSTFKNNSFQIQQPPEGLTGRQVIGYIAQIAGGNAVIDRNGRLVIKTYDFSGFDVEEDVSAGEVETESGIHIISEYTTDPDIGTDDVTITGVSVTIESEDIDTEDEVYVVGSEEYAVSIDNPLISGKEKEAVDLIAESVIGITARPFSGDFFPDPTVEFMDLAYVVDRKDNVYKTFITSHDFSYLGSSTFSCGVESPERHGGSYYSTAAEVYQKAKKDLKINRTQWEQAIENLSQQVASASGLYTTEEEQPDGSTIFYMHNKPTLEESDIVWKMTAETLTVSTDGGHSWNAGITVNGEVIARIMNTIGINFDWGVGGTLIIQDEEGNQTAYIDADTGTVRLAVESLTITGKTVQEIASEQSDETLNNFVDSVYNPAIGNLQAQIDGQIETYYYDYEPTLNNEPASEWTTEEERRNHEGDLFYWKSKGYAYRFFKDGDTWKWQMVQDTDITKALEEAADAKDTADQKRRVFVTQPYPPYDVGDLWVGDDTSEMMRCQRARSSGRYVASDWIKAVKYTDDSELYNFVQNDYNETIKDIYNSVDQKSETWYQATDPALEWTEIESTPLQDTTGANILDTVGETIITIWEKEKSLHNGDLWKNSTTNKEYLYQNGEWVEMPIPDEVFDMIDGKAQIFVVQPTPPYAVGDVWFTGTTILVCDTARESGEFNANDWTKRDNYTDDSALYEFIEGDYASTIDELQTQSDKKAETWYQANDPSTHWNADEKLKHDGDLWYNTSSQKTYIYNGSAWEETKSNPPDEVFDTIDGKAQIFVRQPLPPYAVGDLWFDSASSDIMTCIYSRESGNFNAGDWQKRNKYTDDSALQNFLSGEYSETITELKTQADKKAETWYQGTDPSTSWNATQKAEHEGDLWYNTSNQKTYIYDGTTWQETKSTPPDEVFDSIDGKAQIFISQPTPPYSKGDLWFDSTTSDIMTCIASRSTGSFNVGDWQKRNKYTDDSYAQEINAELNKFISNYQDEITEIQSQIDKKAETWYQPTDPSLQWDDTKSSPLQDTTGASILDTTGATIVTIYESEKALHDGDLWHDTTNNKEYIYVDGEWQETSIPDDVFDIIDGKAQIFVSTPTPPYAIGDLWFNSTTSDIMTCIAGREKGSYNAADWQKRNKYTDDSYAEVVSDNLQNFADQVTGDIDDIQTQLDGKIETYYYDYQPTLSNIPASAWTTETERQKHIGDLFYWKSKGFTYRFLKDGNVWKWQAIKDSDIDEALQQAATAQDTADGKRRVFTSTPTPPYDVGDLWAQGSNGDIMRCKTARSSGAYVSTDWEKASKYTDDTAVDDLDEKLNSTEEIFNRLTQDGKVKGIYLKNGQLYINASYLASGAINIRDSDGNETLYANVDTGVVRIKATSFSLTDGRSIEDIASDEINDFVTSIYTPKINSLQSQIDGQIETYYYDYQPTLTNVPASAWTTETERQSHEGDIFYWKSKGYAYRFYKDGSTWKWQLVQDTDITKALQQAADAKDTADQKRRVFVVTPYPPYDVGDLWVGNNTSDLMRCQRSRSSGSYNADDWIKAVKYTDDTELNNFIREDYSETIQEIYNSVDKKSETWYQTSDPANQWTDNVDNDPLLDTNGNNITDTTGENITTVWEKEKTLHDGDLWHNPNTNKEYIYVDGEWKETSIPDDVFDIIDGKAQIFVSTPTPPYAIGDLWFNSATSDIMTCINARESGSYVSSDWQKRNKYTDDSYAEEVAGDLSNFSDQVVGDLENLQTQIDGKIETYYYDYQPTLSNIPASAWTTETERQKHIGDLFYWKSKGFTYRFLKDGNVWKWQAIKDSDIDEALQQAATAQDTADGKRRVFTSTPTPPYDVGDLWAQGDGGDIMRCIRSRSSGNYTSSDWDKASKYTDDSALNEFLSGEYQETIQELKDQADRKSETWYQSNDPAASWSAEEKENHAGDLWYNTGNQNTYIYNGASWQLTKTTPPDDVFDQIDGKAQIFVNQPVPPYAVGDLWFNSATSDIMTCIRGRSSGSYSSGDWQKRNKYTDDSYAQDVAKELLDFSDAVTGDISNLQTQIDGKIETWYYNYQPTLSNVPASQWTTTTERRKHVGDLFYWQSQGYTYRFQQSGSSFAWQKIQDSDISDAMEEASKAQDTADSKRRVFVTTPVPPYDVGDLWAQGDGGDIMRCIVARSSGSYASTDWDKASKYTDDTAVDDLDNALDQEGVFNRLTNNGQTQGIYLQNNRIYINATYIQSGTLSANLIKGGILTLGGASNGNGRLEVLNPSNQVIGTINNTGVNFTGVFQNRLGQEFIEMDESVLKGGYGSTVHGRIDLSAQYSDGSYRTVIEALSGRLVLKSINGDVEIVRTDGTKAISKGYAVVSIDGNVSTRIETMYITQTGGDYYVGFKNTQNTVRFAILTTSDAKLKKNIKDTKVTALDYINQIQHKSFDLKEGDGHKDCGYIAQDLQKIYPGFVVEAPEYNNDGEKISGTLQVNTFAMFPYITKAIQELSEENRKLKEEIKEIKNMIKSIGGQ